MSAELPVITGDRSAITGDRPAIENENILKIIDYLKKNDAITNSVAMKVLDLKASQTGQILHEMVEQGLLKPKGEKRYRKYILKA